MLAVNTASAQLLQIAHQNWTTVHQAQGTEDAGYPKLLSFGAPDANGNIQKNLVLGWAATGDYAPWNSATAWATSQNAGASYGAMQTNPVSPDGIIYRTDMTGDVRRRDGTLFTIPFRPLYPVTTPGTTFTSIYHTSSDNGATWTVHGYRNPADPDPTSPSGTVLGGATITFPQAAYGMRFHQGIIEENDGTLYAPVYVRYTVDPSWRVVVMKSADGGQSWTYHGTIQTPTSTINYTETTLAICADGSWLAVMRNDDYVGTSGIQSLKQSRSTDGGLTWSAAVSVPGLPSNAGVDPYLMLMPNGILVLSYGHYDPALAGNRNIRMAFSADGNGTSWADQVETFTGSSTLKSTGYTAIAPLRGHRFLQVGDTGTSWSYATPHPTPDPFSIRQKVVDLTLAHKNRIDLATKYSHSPSAITVTTDMTYADIAHPEARASGAFDGSTDYWSGAFKSGTSGTYTIDLQQTYTLNAIGICLHYHNPESATIDLSTNGTTWTTVKSYTNAVHHALDYTDFAATSARYVRVTVTGAGPLVCLNEIELYSTADTFENEGQNVAPYGYTVSPAGVGFWVSEGAPPETGYISARALLMTDSWNSVLPTISKTTTAATTKTLEFRVRTQAFAPTGGAIQFIIRSGSTAAFHMAVFPDGSVKYYNGTAWTNTTGSGSPAGANTVPLNTWKDIKVVASATTGTGTLYVDGVLKGTVGRQTASSTLDGFQFASGGTSSVGDQALFDDVSFQ